MIWGAVPGGGLISILLHAALSHAALDADNDKCGANVKGGMGMIPISRGARLQTYFVDETEGIEKAILECSALCCEQYDRDSYPCDMAFLDFNSQSNQGDAVCAHFTCFDEFGNYICKFRNEIYKATLFGEPMYNYASWVYAFTEDLKPLIDSDGQKVSQALKMKGNLTNGAGKGIGTFSLEEEVRNEQEGRAGRDLGAIEFDAMNQGARAQKKLDMDANGKKMMDILTPLIIGVMCMLLVIVGLSLKYRKLKKTIRYDGVKDADYYTKLDPADMAAEQEAQALINGAYDI